MRSPQRANLTADGVHVKMWVDLGTKCGLIYVRTLRNCGFKYEKRNCVFFIAMVQITHPSRSNYFLLYESILSIYLIFYRFICHNLCIYYKLLDTSLYPFIYLYIYTYTHIFIHIYLCITISVYRRSTQFCCIITH